MRSFVLLTALGWWLADPISAQAAERSGTVKSPGETSSVGQKVANFTLHDYRGKAHSLAEYTDRDAIVLAFIGVECPLAKLYGPRLAELSDQFASRGVAFLAIDSNQQDSVTELAAYARLHGIKFPVLKDLKNELADAVGAKRTPEVFLLDRDRVIRYQGRIDDQYGLTVGSNYAKPKLGERDLAVALDELLSGKPVSRPVVAATGCLIGRVRQPRENSAVTYSNQIARILQNRCVECHRPGEIGPFSLTNYEEVVGWAAMIDEVVGDRRMPPWHASPQFGHFSNDRRMSDVELAQIHEWVENGAPQGDPSQLPPPREYTVGWGIPEPDMVVCMDEKPFQLPAEGTIEYQYFTVDPGFKEDKWIKASECRPGNRSVVHHIFVFVQPPGAVSDEVMGGNDPEQKAARENRRNNGEFALSSRGPNSIRLISGTAPGVPPFKNPKGMAFFVPAGSKFVFQMHYTPNGTATEDRSCIGLCFAKPEEVKATLEMNMAINFAFQIPAGSDNHEVESWAKFDRDTQILALTPHMHLRGKAFRYDLIYPDQRVETILDVPRYDFNWQITYELAKPIHVPAGSKLHCVAHFDNSDGNLANPDATKPVRWGDQTWEEMMIGWFCETGDLDYASMPANQNRTAKFLAAAKTGDVTPSKRIERAATKALESDKAFEILHRLVTNLCPQVDRTDISLVQDGTLRFRNLAQPPIMRTRLGGKETEISGGELALAQYALGDAPVAWNDLTTSQPDADLAFMAGAAASSLHVPIKIDGQPALISFWSRERNAFPPEAMELLVPVARLVGQPK